MSWSRSRTTTPVTFELEEGCAGVRLLGVEPALKGAIEDWLEGFTRRVTDVAHWQAEKAYGGA